MKCREKLFQLKMKEFTINKVLASSVLVGALWFLIKLYIKLVAEPRRRQLMLLGQGIHGPRPQFLVGNIRDIRRAMKSVAAEPVQKSPPTTHDCAVSIFPFLYQWWKTYGDISMFTLGTKQIVLLNQPQVLKEITRIVSFDLGRPSDTRNILGDGILSSNGNIWAHQRKVLAPALYLDQVKGMIALIVESANTVVESWSRKIEEQGGILELKIDEDINKFSGEVLVRTCFGSNYSKGEKLFKLLREQVKAQSNKLWTSHVPGFRHLPTKENTKFWALEKEVRQLVLKVVKEREEARHIEKDLLQSMLEGAKNSGFTGEAMDQFVVDNCKHVYQAGFEATATATSWCLMLLASNPEWQERIHKEILEVCGSKSINMDMLSKMKQLTMVIYESLRLYPPAAFLAREAFKDIKIGDVHIPKGVLICTSINIFHTNPEIWGSDATTFNPNRFVNGLAGSCKYPHMYMPFGFGPHICLGQNLAIAELKILLALVISRFSFTLSPNYVHSPTFEYVTKPKYGVTLLLKER